MVSLDSQQLKLRFGSWSKIRRPWVLFLRPHQHGGSRGRTELQPRETEGRLLWPFFKKRGRHYF